MTNFLYNYIYSKICCCFIIQNENANEKNNKIIIYEKNKYIITNNLIGKGHYGYVFLGLFKNKACAVKIVDKNKVKKYKIDNEIKSLQILRFNVCKYIFNIYEIIDKDYLYIISDIYANGDLYNYIETNKKVSEKVAQYILYQLLNAINFLHTIGMTHRDIKPENIMIDNINTFEIKLIDFGLCKIDKSIITNKNICRHWTRVGTTYYMAPEVINKFYSEKCDEWSCGILYFILLTGYPLYNGETERIIINNIKNNNYFIDNKDWIKISKKSKDILNNLLNRDIAKRYCASDIIENYLQLHII